MRKTVWFWADTMNVPSAAMSGPVTVAASWASWSREPLNREMSTLPPMPGIDPVDVYCQKVAAGQPPIGESGGVHCACHR